jgi:hypothetical protein
VCRPDGLQEPASQDAQGRVSKSEINDGGEIIGLSNIMERFVAFRVYFCFPDHSWAFFIQLRPAAHRAQAILLRSGVGVADPANLRA